jgi:cell division protein FtsW (lipid II flippase)
MPKKMFLWLIAILFLANIAIAQPVYIADLNYSQQKSVNQEREKEVLNALFWIGLIAILAFILIFIGPKLFRRTRRKLRRLLLYSLMFLIKLKNPDETYIRNRLFKYGFKRRHIADAAHRFRKNWGFK